MFNNFFKTTFRSLWKNKGYSLLNIAGLAIGIACAGLIFLWVEDEKNYDGNNTKKDRLYLVKTNVAIDAGVFTHSSTPGLLGPSLKAEMPGIASTCRVTEGQTKLLFTIAGKAVYAAGNYAETSIFNMFTLPFVQGNPQNVFSQLHSIVITERTAVKFFGADKNIMGKTVRVDNKQDYVVTGVLKDLPENASLQFEWLMPFQVFYQQNEDHLNRWGNYGLTTYVELKPGIQPAGINKQLTDYIQQKEGAATSVVHFFLFGMNNWRLHDDFDNGRQTDGGRIQYVQLFSVIAWIILLIACINFMNLATARSEKRAREVGVRKVLGAGKKRLMAQFVGEAVLMAFLASIFAVVIMVVSLPLFNTLVQKNLSLGFDRPVHLIVLLVLTLVCGVIAGSYPSLYLSSFNPVFVLKGIKLKTGSAAFIRKGLVVLQFTISIVLIIGTIIVYQQIQHVKERNMGFNKNNLLQMDVHGEMIKHFPAIKTDLINTGAVENVTLADHAIIYAGDNTSSIDWQGKDPNSLVIISQRMVAPEFIPTVGMQLLAGRDFVPADITEFDSARQPKDPAKNFNVLVTGSLEKLMGKGTAVGKVLQRQTDKGLWTLNVVGVVKDYVYGNMYGKPDPVIFYCIPQAGKMMYVKTKPESSTEQGLAKIEAVMKADNPAYPFDYKFVDDQFNAMFLSEMLISKLSRVFASLAIIISCLGLFGLAAYTAERRTKEIGVRKVLGASVPGITALLSADFLQLVGISCIAAFPVAWLIMDKWLQHYQYRVAISWWIFLMAGLAAIFIALATVSFQAIKAAVANPVKSLRTE